MSEQQQSDPDWPILVTVEVGEESRVVGKGRIRDGQVEVQITDTELAASLAPRLSVEDISTAEFRDAMNRAYNSTSGF